MLRMVFLKCLFMREMPYLDFKNILQNNLDYKPKS